ncbi:MAG: PEP-CTERM sorting domain-containing protein [Candidatus Solibacter usitatus]|nr:PEP-CTERM sorting domain-containing protein [Candidatus Solibacter usitatus]
MIRRLVATLGLLAAGNCFADSITLNGVSGSNSASVTFNFATSSILQVTLSNTTIAGATSANDVLTGLYFSAPGLTFTPMSAKVSTSANIQNCPGCAAGVTNISGEWQYSPGVQNLIAGNPAFVLSAANFGYGGSRIGSTNLAGTTGVGGIDFGIVSPTTSFGQAAFTGSALVTQSVVFTMTTSQPGNASMIGLSGFLWGLQTPGTMLGAELQHGGGGGVPEPGTFVLLGGALIAIGLWRRKASAVGQVSRPAAGSPDPA